MIELRFTSNQTQPTASQRQTWQGREFLVLPVVALVAGVLNGEFVAAAEIARGFGSWNGRPVTLDHPMVDGHPVSVNSPEMLAAYQVGHLFNAHLGDSRLKGEMWIDVLKADESDGGRELLRRAESAEPIEVSTAYFRTVTNEAGTWNGKAYTMTAYDLKPDHLAVLLDGRGACNWQDGCGAPRVNAYKHEHAARIHEPGQYEKIRRQNDKFGEGIHVIWGITGEGKTEVQAIRFDKEKFTPAQARAWLKEHDYAPIEFEPAQEEVETNMRANILSQARTPSYDGTEEISWADVTKTFEAYRDGYYQHGGGERPDDPPTRVQDAPTPMKRWIASKTLLGSPDAESDRELIFFPVVNPGTNKLNAGAVRAVLGGRAAQADIPEGALESAQSVARRLLEDEFAGEPATNAIRRAFQALGRALGFASNAAEVDKEEQARRVREAFYNAMGLRDEARWKHWIRAVFDERVIVEDKTGLLSYGYRITDLGTIAFDEPIRVEIMYQPVESQPTGNQADPEPPQNTEVEDVDKQLLAQVAAKFGLAANDEDPVGTLQALLAYEPAQPCAEYQALIAHVREHGGPESALVALQAAETEQARRRQALVDQIRANRAGEWSDEELATLELATLEKLAKVGRPANYAGQPAQPIKGEQTYQLPEMGI